jgi:hypothetical protein
LILLYYQKHFCMVFRTKFLIFFRFSLALFALHRTFWHWVDCFCASVSSSFWWYIIRSSWWSRCRDIRIIQRKVFQPVDSLCANMGSTFWFYCCFHIGIIRGSW